MSTLPPGRRLLRIVSPALAVVSLAWIGYVLVDHGSDVAATFGRSGLAANGSLIAGLFACYALSWVVASLQFYGPLRAMGVGVGFGENLALFVLGVLLNYAPFKAGVLYRFHYMEQRYRVSYTSFAGLQALRTFVSLVISGVGGALALLYLLLVEGAWSARLLTVVVALLLAGSVPIALETRGRRLTSARLRSLHAEFYGALGRIRSSPFQLGAFVALALAQFAILVWQYHLVFVLAGVSVPAVGYLLIVPLIASLGVVSISPGNLGIREIVTAWVLSAVDLSFEQGLTIGVLERAVLLVATLSLGGISLVYLGATGRWRTRYS